MKFQKLSYLVLFSSANFILRPSSILIAVLTHGFFILPFSLSKFLECYFAESSPRSNGSADDWRTAFDAAANGSVSRSGSSSSRSRSNGHSRPTQNGDIGPNSASRRTPNRLPPAPPGASGYKF